MKPKLLESFQNVNVQVYDLGIKLYVDDTHQEQYYVIDKGKLKKREKNVKQEAEKKYRKSSNSNK